MTLKLLLDEQIGRHIQKELNRRVYTKHVVDVSALGSGASDKNIWQYAVQNDYIVFSMDSHFVDGTADPNNGTHPGIIKCNTRNVQTIGDKIRKINSHLTHRTIVDNDLELYVPGSW